MENSSPKTSVPGHLSFQQRFMHSYRGNLVQRAHPRPKSPTNILTLVIIHENTGHAEDYLMQWRHVDLKLSTDISDETAASTFKVEQELLFERRKLISNQHGVISLTARTTDVKPSNNILETVVPVHITRHITEDNVDQ
jgi:hypothetical protein